MSILLQDKIMISLEGNVGVGKSTILKELERRGFKVHFEAVDHWTLLKQFYKHPATYSFAFQLQVLASYCQADESTQIVERSAEVALSVFVPLAKSCGNITDEQHVELVRVAKMLPLQPISKFIFLVASPELCLQRIAWRNRDGEEEITLEYLQTLDTLYESFMNSIPDSRKVVIHVRETDSPLQIADKCMESLNM